MAGISAKANGNLQNNYKFNDGTELQHQEFSDGTGLELYATDFRSYDPQIGRFHQIDPLSELAEDWSPYTFAMNNPISFLDPFGLDTVKVKIDANTGTGSATNADGSSGTYKKDENGNVVGTGMSGNGGDVTVTSHPKKDKEQSDNSGSDSKDNNKDTQSPLPAPAPSPSPIPDKGGHLSYEAEFVNQSRTQGNLIWYNSDGDIIGKYKATSGSGNPAYYTVPQGQWNASNYRETNDPKFMRNQIGFKISLGPDRYDPLRGRKTAYILIHPARSLGTQGCIGLIGPKGEIIDFQTKISMYLRTYGTIPINISYKK